MQARAALYDFYAKRYGPAYAEHQKNKHTRFPTTAIYEFLSKRYGLGYAESHGTSPRECSLVSTYLPNHPEYKETNLPQLPLVPFLDLADDLLGSPSCNGGQDPSHLTAWDRPFHLSQEEIDSLIEKGDKHFKQLESLESKIPQKKQALPDFSKPQVGITKSIKTNKVLWFKGYGFREKTGEQNEGYSIILSFPSAVCLDAFLDDGIPVEDRRYPDCIYVIYKCFYGPGCYQLLIPHGSEQEALALLLGKNQYTKELPVTRYILDKLKLPGLFAIFQTTRPADEQLSVALWLMQMCIMKRGVVTLDDFDESTQKLIKTTPAFSATLDFCKNNEKIEGLLNSFLIPEVAHLIMGYRGSTL